MQFGMRPYADNTYFVVGMQNGYFKDVGISIQPEPTGLKPPSSSGCPSC